LGIHSFIMGDNYKLIKQNPEKKSRNKKINPALEATGWSILKKWKEIPKKGNCALYEYPTKSGPVDYALVIDGKIIGLVEAKKEEEEVYSVLTQAKRYARDLINPSFDFSEFKVPFIYSTNGNTFYFQDLRKENSRSRKVLTFHKPEALLEEFDKDLTRADLWLVDNPIKQSYISNKEKNPYYLRYYQEDAVQAIENNLQKNKRKLLVGMATGTGKTVTVLAHIYRMLKSGKFKRILFLVDRVELANQAIAAMASFEPEPGQKFDRIYEVFASRIPEGKEWKSLNINTKKIPESKINNPQANDAHILVSTIQGMYRFITGQKEPEKEIQADVWGRDVDKIRYDKKIPIHAFDLIISDECHRSIYNKWRIVLDYFDSAQIGLTATPAAHTYTYFDGNLAYTYSLQKAVQDGFLVDYDVVHIDTKITMEGLKIKKGTQIRAIETNTKDTFYAKLPDDFTAEPKKIERSITAIDRNRKIVNQFSKFFREKGASQKTLFFAVNDRHADQLVKLLREEFSDRGDRFVEKITYKVDKAPDMIKQFRNRKFPMIAVTVDMVTTGVDIPKIENIVFVRPVNSRILFEQMMGRGTRRCNEIGKTHFTVFDTLKLLEFMKKHKLSDFIQPPMSQTLAIREVINFIKKGFNRDQNIDVLVRKLQRIDKGVSEEGREDFSKFIPDGDVSGFASELKNNFKKNYSKTIKLFENTIFLDLLENYPRKKRFFFVDELSQDKVMRIEESLTTIEGKEVKPQDYLKQFEEFVQTHKKSLIALKILLEKPEEFNVKDLDSLRRELQKSRYIFTERRLRKAAHNNVADIIAFINMAAKHVPLVSPEKRVEIAFRKILWNRQWEFNEKQKQWLELIKKHVIKNLIIKKEDFNEQFILNRKGNFEDWNSVFNGKLTILINTINKEVLTV